MLVALTDGLCGSAAQPPAWDSIGMVMHRQASYEDPGPGQTSPLVRSPAGRMCCWAAVHDGSLSDSIS